MSHDAPSHATPIGQASHAGRVCQNCETPLQGPYCSRCGQHDIDYTRSFGHLVEDVLENLFHFDGKFLVSVAWLLAKPGRLTLEFNRGRRASQLPPLRFYIFTTVLFFLGINLLNHGHIFSFDRKSADALTAKAQIEADTKDFDEAQRAELGRRIEQRAAQGNFDAAAILIVIEEMKREKAAETASRGGIDPTAKNVSPVAQRRRSNAHGLFAGTGRSIEEKLQSGELKFSQIADEVEHRVPTLLFLGMPVFALILKLLYLRAGHHYIEHLIFSLHLHTWAFLVLMVGNGYLKLAGLGPEWIATLLGWAIFVWMVWYVLAAFRTVYGQSWQKSAIKASLASLSYSFALCCLAIITVGLTLMWLAHE